MESQRRDYAATGIHTRLGRAVCRANSGSAGLDMIFSATHLAGAFIIEPERLADRRGFFARTWCQREWESHGLDARLAQCSISFNTKRGTLRGMHYQAAPYAEAKLVRCTAGA